MKSVAVPKKPTLAVVRKPLNRDLIVEIARAMIAEFGHEAFSMRPLARKLGVTATALYAHFDNKLDLLYAVAEGEYGRLATAYENALADDPVEKIWKHVWIYYDYAVANPQLCKIIILFPPELIPEDGISNDSLGQRIFNVTMQPVKQAIVEGKFRAVDPVRICLSLWSAVHGIANFAMMRAERGELISDESMKFIVSNLLAGLALPTGDERIVIPERN